MTASSTCTTAPRGWTGSPASATRVSSDGVHWNRLAAAGAGAHRRQRFARASKTRALSRSTAFSTWLHGLWTRVPGGGRANARRRGHPADDRPQHQPHHLGAHRPDRRRRGQQGPRPVSPQDQRPLCRLPPPPPAPLAGAIRRTCAPGPASGWPPSTVPREENWWDCKSIGANGVPIETPEGWLCINHGYDFEHVYRFGVVLLDLEDPTRVIRRPKEPSSGRKSCGRSAETYRT